MPELRTHEPGVHLSARVLVGLDGLYPRVGRPGRRTPRNPAVWRLWSTSSAEPRRYRASICDTAPWRPATARSASSRLLPPAAAAAATSTADAVSHRVVFLVWRRGLAGGGQEAEADARGARRGLSTASAERERRAGRGAPPQVARRVLQQQQPRRAGAHALPAPPAESSQCSRASPAVGPRWAIAESAKRVERWVDPRTAAGASHQPAPESFRHESEQPGGEERHRQDHD